MYDLMLDLETLSTSPRAAIVQIGACYFDRHTGEIGETFNAKCAPNFKHYQADFSTIQWWMGQSDEARQSVFTPGVADINFVVSVFAAFLGAKAASPDFRVWAMPAAFDVVIMEHAFEVEGYKTPWKYNASRDCRTIFEIAGFDKTDLVKPEVAHDALSDAIAQAKSVAKAFQRIG